MELKKITLQNGKESNLLRFHPWIFSGAIKTMEEGIEDGEIVAITDVTGKSIAKGIYQKGSIAIKILSFSNEEINSDFWTAKINKAYQYRKSIGITESKSTNTYRLIFGEADGLPGLIIDVYNGHYVLQAHSLGMYNQLDQIKDSLIALFGKAVKTVYNKSKDTVPKFYADQAENGFLFGNTGSTEVIENGHKFKIDWETGQKTGFFIDQRESRQLLTHYCKDKKVLNTFCYTGGFSIYAAKAGASMVHSVDSSKVAIGLTNENAVLNGVTNHEAFVSDTVDFLKQKKDVYDLIILDPPAYAKSRDVKHNAVIGYKKLNELAFKQIKPGGIIFTFSCSQVIDKSLFAHTITSAAIEAKREVKILHYLGQPADHPINVFFPEGEYLKGLILHVS